MAILLKQIATLPVLFDTRYNVRVLVWPTKMKIRRRAEIGMTFIGASQKRTLLDTCLRCRYNLVDIPVFLGVGQLFSEGQHKIFKSEHTPKRLLVLSCSQRKSSRSGQIPAIERYDGPLFHVLRKYLREHPDCALEVWIISAKYRLISSDRKIPDYDSKMTPVRANEMKTEVQSQLFKLLQRDPWDHIGIGLSKMYLRVVEGIDAVVPSTSRVDWLRGGQGIRLAELYFWLRQRPI